MTPEWFSRTIKTGLMTVYSLSPDGCPGADMFPITCQVWADDLWESARCDWMPEDEERIGLAFKAIRANNRRWPQQADFWTHLPPRMAAGPALPSRVFTEEERAENIRRLAEIVKELGMTP